MLSLELQSCQMLVVFIFLGLFGRSEYPVIIKKKLSTSYTPYISAIVSS